MIGIYTNKYVILFYFQPWQNLQLGEINVNWPFLEHKSFYNMNIYFSCLIYRSRRDAQNILFSETMHKVNESIFCKQTSQNHKDVSREHFSINYWCNLVKLKYITFNTFHGNICQFCATLIIVSFRFTPEERKPSAILTFFHHISWPKCRYTHCFCQPNDSKLP